MDKAQLNAFVDYMIGWRTVGATNEGELTTPTCPEMRSFVLARLGEKTPTHGYDAVRDYKGCGTALAALLHEAADGLGSPEASLDHAQRLIASLLRPSYGQKYKDAQGYLERFRPDLIKPADGETS